MKVFTWNKRRSNAIRGLVCIFLLCFANIVSAANALAPLCLDDMSDMQYYTTAIPENIEGLLDEILEVQVLYALVGVLSALCLCLLLLCGGYRADEPGLEASCY